MELLWFDIEATGPDPYTDRIIELAWENRAGGKERWRDSLRVNPGIPIPAEATAVHGITDEDVGHCQEFDEVAGFVQALFASDVVICGYNSLRYDVPLIDTELRRAGQPGLDMDSLREIDVFRVWKEIEPRTLVGAVKRWLSEDFEGAHAAADDIDATRRVFEAMSVPLERAIEFTRPADMLDRAGKFRIDGDGVPILAFGKHDGQPAVYHPGYLDWMLTADFPPDTKAVCRSLLAGATV